MEKNGLGRRINTARKDQGFTADKLSEICNINATYLRQIEGGKKIPSLPVFIDICNALKVSSDYLLQDTLVTNDVSRIKNLDELWENASPRHRAIVSAMIQAVLNLEENPE